MSEHKKPLGSTDKRKLKRHPKVEAQDEGTQGAGKPLAHLFHDRRSKKLGSGKRAS